jgi:hypothetical protein
MTTREMVALGLAVLSAIVGVWTLRKLRHSRSYKLQLVGILITVLYMPLDLLLRDSASVLLQFAPFAVGGLGLLIVATGLRSESRRKSQGKDE